MRNNPQNKDGCTASQPPKIAALGARLDIAERELLAREAIGERHSARDFDDPDTRELLHDFVACPWCEFRNIIRAYRRLARAPVIKRAGKCTRGMGYKTTLFALWRAQTRYDDNGDMPDVFPPLTTRQRVDLAAEIETLEAEIDLLLERAATRGRKWREDCEELSAWRDQ